MEWNSQKEFPENYPRRLVEILKTMSFSGHPNVIGSAALRSIQYIGDYDSDEYNVKATPAKFKKIIKNLMSLQDVYIGDIKCGEMDGEPIRWTVQEILKGKQIMDGHIHTLADCIRNPVLFKLDVVAFIDNRYTELSIIYIYGNGPRLTDEQFKEELKKEVQVKYDEKMFYKMSKRIFSIVRLENDTETALKLLPLFNGDLGRLYSIISDLDALVYLFEHKKHINKARMNSELENIKSRMSNIWNLSTFVKNEKAFLKIINRQLKRPNPETLIELGDKLFVLLNKYAERALKELKLIPPPKRFLP
jgi:hypothetical protein